MTRRSVVTPVALWLCCTLPGLAYELSDEERTIPILYRHIGITHNVPYKILYAIALAESGYLAPSNGQIRPWPWTLNFNGRAARYESKALALDSLQAGLDQGLKNIDIGLAQVNFKYNGKMLPSIPQSLDPMTNLIVATRILKRELDHCEVPNWWCAVGRYHSPGNSERQVSNRLRYTDRVRDIWEQLQ